MAGPASDFADLRIHVGYHKTGSTLLQERLLLPAHGISSAWPQRFYHRHLLLDRPDRGWAARVRAAFTPGIEQARAEGLVPVMSCEALSGDIWRLGQANGYGNFHVAALLAQAFPGARVALVHREQRSMVVSLYKHSVRSHWRYSLEAFLDQGPLELGMAPLLHLGYLEYSWLLEAYQRELGAERVLALPYELIRADRAAWSAAWADFLGVPVDPAWFDAESNPGMSALTARLKRRANMAIPATATPNRTRTARYVNSVAHQVDAVVPAAARRRSEDALRQDVRALLGDRFHEDNARLFELLGTDWRHLGYDDGRQGEQA